MIIVVLQRWAVGKRNVAGALVRKPVPRRLGRGASIAAHAVCYAIVLASSLPSLIVIFTSFRKTSGPVFHPGFSLDSYSKITPEVPHVITNTPLYSLTSPALTATL